MSSFMCIQNDALIPLVEKRPVLWDGTFEVPKRKKAKRKAWKDLCKELHGDFEEMEDEEKDEYVNAVKQRWQCLQDTYFKKKELHSSSSGVKKYIYAEKMRFLEKDSIESPSVSAGGSNGFSNEPSKDVPTPDPTFSKLAADFVFQKEKTDNFDSLKYLKADNIEPMSSGDESFKSIQTSCSEESMLADEQHEGRIIEVPKDKFLKGLLKNGFTDEPPKDRSTPKHQAKDLGFHKEVSEKINDLKTKEKSKKSEDKYMDKLCINESSEDILLKNLELTDDPNEDKIQPKNGLSKNRFPKKLQNNESTNVPDKTVDLKNGQKSKSENADSENLAGDPSEGSSGKSLKDVFAEKLKKDKTCKESSKKKSSKKQGKNKSADQLPEDSKKPHKNKTTGQLPNRTSKRRHKNKHTDLLPENRTSKRLRESDQLSADKLVEDSREGNVLNASSADKSTNDLPQNGFTTKPSELNGNRSTDKLTDDFTEREISSTTEKLTGFSSTPSSIEPHVLEIEGNPHTGVILGESSGEVNHLGSMRLKPEISSTFNLFLRSVTPHLDKLDQSEVLEFQMGVLQVIRHINEKREERLNPQLFLDPQMPKISYL